MADRYDLREFSNDGEWDVSEWASEDEGARARARDEHAARDALYGSPSGTVTASPINPPIA